MAENLLRGKSNADIAAVRGTSLRTVENQVSQLLVKLGVGSRAELLAYLYSTDGDITDGPEEKHLWKPCPCLGDADWQFAQHNHTSPGGKTNHEDNTRETLGWYDSVSFGRSWRRTGRVRTLYRCVGGQSAGHYGHSGKLLHGECRFSNRIYRNGMQRSVGELISPSMPRVLIRYPLPGRPIRVRLGPSMRRLRRGCQRNVHQHRLYNGDDQHLDVVHAPVNHRVVRWQSLYCVRWRSIRSSRNDQLVERCARRASQGARRAT